MAHTKGPWEIEKYSDGMLQIVGDVRVISDDEEHVTTIVEEVSYKNEANARLIAAAPELLEALEAAIECGMVPNSTAKDGGAASHARQVVVADMIRDAVAKAKGLNPDQVEEM